MAGPSAKQIPYGMDGIHMELASIPPGIRLECGGTVKTSNDAVTQTVKLFPHTYWAFLNINFIQAYDHIKTRKSKIASTILDCIKTFFAKPEFVGNSARVKDCIKWALAKGGAAYYSVPTPKDCSTDRNDVNFV